MISQPSLPGLKRFHLALLACAALILAACSPAHEWHGSPYQDPGPAPPVELTTTAGEEFSLEQLEGQIVMLFFGYTSCPDVCPATTADAAKIFDTLGEANDDVEFVFITVDPARDDPEAIRAYLDTFHPDFIGLYGSQQELDQVKSAYGVFSQPDDQGEDGQGDDHEHDHDEDEAHTHDHGEGDYTVTHTSRVFLVDPQGRLVTNYTFGTPREDILADIRYLLE